MSAKEPIAVWIVDDHPMVVSGLKGMLQDYSPVKVKDTFANGKALLKALELGQPDVLLLDIQLPDISGNELARIIASSYPQVNMLAVSSMDSSFHINDMLRNGCKGYLLKTVDKATLIEAIEQVSKGDEFIDPHMERQLNRDRQGVRGEDVIASLTRREREILVLVSRELTNHQISEKLGISQRTVENYRLSLMQKLQVKNAVALTRIAFDLGLL